MVWSVVAVVATPWPAYAGHGRSTILWVIYGSEHQNPRLSKSWTPWKSKNKPLTKQAQDFMGHSPAHPRLYRSRPRTQHSYSSHGNARFDKLRQPGKLCSIQDQYHATDRTQASEDSDYVWAFSGQIANTSANERPAPTRRKRPAHAYTYQTRLGVSARKHRRNRKTCLQLKCLTYDLYICMCIYIFFFYLFIYLCIYL